MPLLHEHIEQGTEKRQHNSQILYIKDLACDRYSCTYRYQYRYWAPKSGILLADQQQA